MFVFIASFLMYLILVWSGSSIPDIDFVIAFLLASVITFTCRSFHPKRAFSLKMLDPRRWLGFGVYLVGPFAMGLLRANLDIAKRVLTGRIRPGIVKVTPSLKSDFARVLLAESINMNTGTLTVDVDDCGVFYIHCMSVEDENPCGEALYGNFEQWAGRLFE